MDKKKLRELIIKAIDLVQKENEYNYSNISKENLYVIFTEDWNSKYWTVMQKLNEENKYNVYAVISNKVNNTLHLNNLKKFKICKKILTEEDINFKNMDKYLTLFPIISRKTVVKTALCLDDTFETKWIFNSMEKGQRIILLKSGLKKFTGKEPISYVKKILSYYKTLLEFNIEIYDDIKNIENCINISEIKNNNKLNNKNSFKDKKRVSYINSNRDVIYNKIPIKNLKKIITKKELKNYVKNKKIILKNQDLITDLAIDEARRLNIKIIRE